MSCKNIIVVGNAGSVLTVHNGGKIDGFDYVVRMGNCPIYGFEKYVGTKTDLYRAAWDRLIHVDRQNLMYQPINLHFKFKDLLFLETDSDVYYETSALGTNTRFIKMYKKSPFPPISFNTLPFLAKPQRFLHERCLEYFVKIWNIQNVYYLSIEERIMAYYLINSKKPEDELFVPSSGIFTLCYILCRFPNDNIYITGFDGFKTKYYWRDTETFFTGHNSYREQIALKHLVRKGRINVL